MFPHQIADLSIAVSCLSSYADPSAHAEWAYRYIVLLWLSLITKIPFDFDRFDDGADAEDARGSVTKKSMTTAQTLEQLGKKYLIYAGLEGVSAALLLAGLYTR